MYSIYVKEGKKLYIYVYIYYIYIYKTFFLFIKGTMGTNTGSPI